MFSAGVQRRRPLVSLTPLIDVVFILLVFFMLASSFLQWRTIELDAGQASGGSGKGAILIDILPDTVRFGARTVTLAEMTARVSEQVQRDPGQKVLVRPAAGIPLQRSVDILDLLAQAGAKNVSLVGR